MMNRSANMVLPRNRASRLAMIFLKRMGLRNGLLLLIAVVAIALALNPSWLSAMGLPPLMLLSLPGLALWALGECKNKRGNGDFSHSKVGAAVRGL